MTKKECFWELYSNLILKVDEGRFPNCEYYFRGNKCLIEFSTNYGESFFSYLEVWGIFKEKYGLKHNEIRMLIKAELEEHFKYEVKNPYMSFSACSTREEKHFMKLEFESRPQ